MANKPFGEPHSCSSPTSYGFTGKDLDDSGLYYFAARYYDALTGRFISEDTWIGTLEQPWTQNRYVYVGNTPLVYVDPTGHWPEWVNALTEFSTGFMEGFAEAISYRQAPAPQASTGWQQAGQIVGNTAVMLVGLAEGAAGGGMTAGGFVTAATPAGAFLVVVNVKAVATGSALMASGAGHVVSGAQAMFTKGASSGSQGQSGSSDQPINPKKVSTKYLKQHDIDAHSLKHDVLGGKAPISQYNVFIDRNRSLWLQKTGSKEFIPTYINIVR